jgi:hypothetical protein
MSLQSWFFLTILKNFDIMGEVVIPGVGFQRVLNDGDNHFIRELVVVPCH